MSCSATCNALSRCTEFATGARRANQNIRDAGDKVRTRKDLWARLHLAERDDPSRPTSFEPLSV
jgi:hypothetical protein